VEIERVLSPDNKYEQVVEDLENPSFSSFSKEDIRYDTGK
jgi:hypothetical protein